MPKFKRELAIAAKEHRGRKEIPHFQVLCVLLLLLAAPALAAPLVTRWAATVSPTNVLAEYPRPQMAREQWQNLNGIWNFIISDDHEAPARSFTNQILVPFPWSLSFPVWAGASMNTAASVTEGHLVCRPTGVASGCCCTSAP